jgi:filamentous hemagglutinin
MANGGVETDESRELDKEAARIREGAMYLDIAAMGVFASGGGGNMLTGQALTQIDLVRRAATADNKIIVQHCQAGAQNCTQREVDLSDVAIDKDSGQIYVFNNGIFNREEYALATGAIQNSDPANAQGVYHILNPYTGNPVAELLYAGYDKLNDLLGGRLPLTSASRTNQAIIDRTREQGGTFNSVNHSRGGMTMTNTMHDFDRQGGTLLPIGNLLYNGAAANAQEGANLLRDIDDDRGRLSQSTHPTDLVGRWIGLNPPTSERNDGRFPGSHSSYTGGLMPLGTPIREITDRNWGVGRYSVPRYIPPTPPKPPTPPNKGNGND